MGYTDYENIFLRVHKNKLWVIMVDSAFPHGLVTAIQN